MNEIFKAAVELGEALEAGGFAYCFIGGLAVQRWGENRMTKDADATVLTQFYDDERLVDYLLERFSARRTDARAFALRQRVLLLQASNGIDLDIGLGALNFEVDSVGRATPWKLSEAMSILTCTANDLVVHKAFASRERDWLDVDGILMRQGRKLKIAQIFSDLRPLTELKEDPDIIPRLERMMRKRGLV